MPIMADVAQQRQRISDQLEKLDVERSKLRDRLNELEIAERVLSRFGERKGETRRRGRQAGPRSKEAVPGAEEVRGSGRRRGTAGAEGQSVSLGEATLQAVQAHSGGVAAEVVREYLAKQFALQVRPNHLGMALQRHRRAGRLEIRDSRWHALP